MTATTPHHRPPATTVLGVLSALYAATFFLGALLHTGTRVPIGFAVLAEPRIVPAIVVETLCGSALAVGAYALLAGKSWMWAAATASHAVALAGVLQGTVVAVAAGRGPNTVLNDTYHRVMIVVLVAGLVALSTPAVKTALRHRNSRT